jgi:hypothetical protein
LATSVKKLIENSLQIVSAANYLSQVFGFFRVARFLLIQYTKTGGKIPNDHKITNWL